MKTPQYKSIAEAAWKLAKDGMSDLKISERLGVSDTTARKAVEFFCRDNDLPLLTSSSRREAKLKKACELLRRGTLMKDIAEQVGFSARGLKLALDQYLDSKGQQLPDCRALRGNARSGECAQHPELFPKAEGDEQ